ncbi:MAG: tetratricopeptide repeat protein [Candidatus Edwardsbacteria bacterium]
MGDVYSAISSYPIARGYYQDAIIAIADIDKEKVVDALNGLAGTYQDQSNYAEAMKAAEEAHRSAYEINYKKGIAASLNNIGNVHWYQGGYDEALKYYAETLEIRKEIGDKSGITASLVMLQRKLDFLSEEKSCTPPTAGV